MANSINLPIKQAGSIVTVPSVAELPVNAAEGDCRWVEDVNQLYIYRDGIWAAAGGGVQGPISNTSTDNAIARWDGTTGLLIQDSNVTISDAGSIILPASQTVDGRDVSVDGAALDTHLAASTGVHGVTGSVVGTDDTQTLTNKAIDADLNTIENIADAQIKNSANIDIGKLGTGAVNGTEFNYLTGVTGPIQTQLGNKQETSEKGNANGYASLDAGGKVPVTELPNSIMEFQGNWNATTNTPTLADGTGNTGDVYRVNVAGTQNLGSGAQTFVVGDWAMYNGAIWQLAHAGADAVLSVNGAAGIVTVNAINQLAGHVTAGPASGSQSVSATIAANVITDSMVNSAAGIDATKLGAGTVDNTEFGYLDGVTSAIQSQLGNKQPLDGDLTAVAGLSSTGLIARTAADTMATRTVTGTANRVAVTNGDGVSGNPTLDIGTDVVTLTGAQVLTNKDIDGGVAANNRRITLPAETTTNLNALTRKAGTLVYDTTLSTVKYDDGSALVSISGAANATASTPGLYVAGANPGVINGSTAASGNLNEIVISNSSTPVSTGTSNVNANITSISVPAGSWLIRASVGAAVNTGTSIETFTIGISETSAGSGTIHGKNLAAVSGAFITFDSTLSIIGYRGEFPSTTTVYLTGFSKFGGGQPQWASYWLEAVRVR